MTNTLTNCITNATSMNDITTWIANFWEEAEWNGTLEDTEFYYRTVYADHTIITWRKYGKRYLHIADPVSAVLCEIIGSKYNLKLSFDNVKVPA
jgi:hypothetical protein